MKKIFTVVSIVLLSFSTSAQEKGTHEISLSTGILTSNDIFNMNADIIASFIGKSTDNNKATAAYAFSYKYAVEQNLFLTLDAVYQKFSKDVLKNNVKKEIAKQYNYTLGLGTEYRYISTDWFQMYSGVSLGLTVVKSDYTLSKVKNKYNNYVNFHINALGFRFGKELAVFFELGLGYKGIGNLGLAYQF